MKTPSIAIMGESMIEIRNSESGLGQGFAGDTINTAIYLKRVWKAQGISDNHVSYITALGGDKYSSQMLEFWQRESVATDLVFKFEDKLPGLYRIETDADGERSFFYWRSDSAARYLFQHPQIGLLQKSLTHFEYLYLSGISLAILPAPDRELLVKLLQQYRHQGGKVIFDNNYRAKLWESPDEAIYWFGEIINQCDICLFSFDDELELYGEHSLDSCIKRVLMAGVSELILKRGSLPCTVATPSDTFEVTIQQVDLVVDTTAAGDSFNGAYLAARLSGADIRLSIEAGHALASQVIQYPGAIISKSEMPNFSW